ncbi:MAG: DinB family protein [Chloroflexota bacterium]|nr:DinB family protein [Dehalococcoidia bacterium]MDW8253039.1 DinB family protein [Chloroflexota bacterium]
MAADPYRHGLIARLRASGEDVVWCAELFPRPHVDWAPEGEWSARQIVTHLRDVEHGVQIARIQAAVLEDNPTFPRFDAAAWRAAHRPASETYDEVVDDFAAGRRALAALLDRLDAEDWSRPVRSAAFGLSTLEAVAERAYLHTLDHIGQLLRLRRTLLAALAGEGASGP